MAHNRGETIPFVLYNFCIKKLNIIQFFGTLQILYNFLTQKNCIKELNFQGILLYLLCLGKIWDYEMPKVLAPRCQMSTFIRKMIKIHGYSSPNSVLYPTISYLEALRGKQSDFTVFKILIFLYKFLIILYNFILIILYKNCIKQLYNPERKQKVCQK